MTNLGNSHGKIFSLLVETSVHTCSSITDSQSMVWACPGPGRISLHVTLPKKTKISFFRFYKIKYVDALIIIYSDFHVDTLYRRILRGETFVVPRIKNRWNTLVQLQLSQQNYFFWLLFDHVTLNFLRI